MSQIEPLATAPEAMMESAHPAQRNRFFVLKVVMIKVAILLVFIGTMKHAPFHNNDDGKETFSLRSRIRRSVRIQHSFGFLGHRTLKEEEVTPTATVGVEDCLAGCELETPNCNFCNEAPTHACDESFVFCIINADNDPGSSGRQVCASEHYNCREATINQCHKECQADRNGCAQMCHYHQQANTGGGGI